MIKLDLKDKKLLYELDLNSRESYHRIAKKIGLSKDAVIYRIKRLQREGIIKKFHTVLDVGKLGYISFRLYLKLQNTTPEIEQEIIEFLKNRAEITWIVSIEGEYDLGMWVLTKTVKEMNQLWALLLKNYLNFIDKRWLTIFTKVRYFPRSYLLDIKQNDKEFIFITEPEPKQIDEIDIEILKMLAPDARVSILEIARKLNVSAKMVSYRIKNLEKNKIIIGYRTMFDLEKLNRQYFKLLINVHNIDEVKEKEFRFFVKQHPNVVYDSEVLGGDDFEIEIEVNDLQELRGIINEIKTRFASIIKDYKTMLFYKEHKYVFFPA